jgi:hypothetical protein
MNAAPEAHAHASRATATGIFEIGSVIIFASENVTQFPPIRCIQNCINLLQFELGIARESFTLF